MKNKVFIFVIAGIFFLGTNVRAVVFDLVTEPIKWIGDQTKQINDEIFQKTMIAKTIENIGILQKNFNESKKFYDEMRMISQNPAMLSDAASEELRLQWRRNRQNFIDNFETRRQQAYNREEGIIQRGYNKSMDYIKDQLTFQDKMIEMLRDKSKDIEENNKNLKAKPGESPEDRRARLEEARLKNELTQTELLWQLNVNLIQTQKSIKGLYDLYAEEKDLAVSRQKSWEAGLKEIQKSVSSNKLRTSAEALREVTEKLKSRR